MRKATRKLLPLFCLLVLLSFSQSASIATGNPTATPINHVVVIMMENHSFDNIFGVYPTMNRSQQGIQNIEVPSNLLNRSNPAGLIAVPNGTFSTANPSEIHYLEDWDNGAMDGFANYSGVQSMTYFTSSQLALEWDWAEEYSIGDNYFASYLGETAPNRIVSLAGYTPVDSDYGPPPYLNVNQSIFGELSSFGVSWAYYVDGPSPSDYPLEYFSDMSQYSSNIRDWSDFASALSSNSLPSVSWVMPVGGNAHGVDQHPPDNVTEGEVWLLGIVNEVMNSPSWQSTAIFIVYDEGGGYYDQIPPPVLAGQQLGFRVPLIVISPYAKEDYVSHTTLNHGSLLAFIDYNWHMPALNNFVAESNLPLDAFDFNEPYSGGSLVRAPVVLNESSSFPENPEVPFASLPYARSGSSSITLQGMGSSLFLTTSNYYTSSSSSNGFPSFVLGTPLLVIIFGVATFLLVFVARARNRRYYR